jgi:hypothetical protein
MISLPCAATFMIFGYHLWGLGRNVEKEQFEKAVARGG